MEEKQKGGARSNAGRKPTDDPKIPITIYIQTSVVEKNGGKANLAQRILDGINSDFVENPVTTRNSVPREKKKVKVTNLTENKTTNISIDTEIPPMPIKEPNEDSYDFAARKNEWKLKYNQ